MADIPFDALQSGGGDGVRLNGTQLFAVPTSGGVGVLGSQLSAATDISSALTTLINITGKYTIGYVLLQGINATSGSLRIQVIVDGVTVADSTFTSNTLTSVLVLTAPYSAVRCNSSFEVKATKPLATAVTGSYIALAVL